jgi:hypothetical protein
VLLYRIVEVLLVTALVTGSLLWLFGTLMPSAYAGLRLRVAVSLNKRGRPSWMRALASRLAAVPAASTAGCGSGCSSCSGCGLSRVVKARPADPAQTL